MASEPKQKSGIGMRAMRAWRALLGDAAGDESARDLTPGGAEAIMARMRLDLEDTRKELERTRGEFSGLERRMRSDVESARGEALVRFARRVGPLLSQIATMKALAAEGREVRREDLLTMVGKLEAAFVEAGIQPIGTVGGEATFDPRLHQRMSGGDVGDGDRVRVRFVGYAYGEQVVTKAMVSRHDPGAEGSTLPGGD